MTAVLGGGLSGLSAAYYALENPKLGPVILLEASNRLGGWVQSKKSPSGAVFELGPRTIRPRGETGQNTLNLIDDLKLSTKLRPISVTDPAASNKFIYAKQKLHPLPISLKPLFKTCPPFNEPLISTIWREIRQPSIINKDESLYSFIERRVGSHIADYIISPMICGICAGDAKEISVKFLMPSIFRAEQLHGSIFRGMIHDKLFQQMKSKKPEPWEIVPEKTDKSIMSSAERAQKSNWAIWALDGGMEQLPQALASRLHHKHLHIRLGIDCKEIIFKPEGAELRAGDQSKTYERVVSSIPAKNLAKLVENQHPDLANELDAIPSATVAVVNLEFAGHVLPMEAFGFLVPPKEELPILGVIFDSCVIKQDSTVLTVMMGGAWYDKYFGKSDIVSSMKDHLLSVALDHVKSILNIKATPISSNVSILKDCIPQYIVGHNERVERIQNYISENKLPLYLCGASYEGVGVNDVIFSARKAVSSIAS